MPAASLLQPIALSKPLSAPPIAIAVAVALTFSLLPSACRVFDRLPWFSTNATAAWEASEDIPAVTAPLVTAPPPTAPETLEAAVAASELPAVTAAAAMAITAATAGFRCWLL
ncbi:Uncharacterised protein [Serratia marcescens]|nr:Uncharacterised protein [Serratia marcescens]